MPYKLTIKAWGNLGNRLLQYMGALAILKRFPAGELVGFEIPEMRVHTSPRSSFETAEYTLRFPYDVFDQIALKLAKGAKHLEIDWHMQRMEWLETVDFYRARLPSARTDVPEFGPDDLVINVRAGADVRSGDFHWYPLIPISYYRWIVQYLELRPVFMGQLEPCSYVEALRAEFPNGRFLSTEGIMWDFDVIRRATNILISPSTFAWCAAWMSNAHSIHVPMVGWLNPVHERDIDLLPSGDGRYRFYQFPLYHALPEHRALRAHRKIEGRWREISPRRVTALRTANTLLPLRSRDAQVLDAWYLEQYPEAGMEISDGIYEDATHHYQDIGWRRGYLPWPKAKPSSSPGVEISLGKPADQSSISQWSVGRDTTSDASRAVDGQYDREYSFHTDHERNPWWRVDLGRVYGVRAIVLHNRLSLPVIEARANRLCIEVSTCGMAWRCAASTSPEDAFDSGSGPLVLEFPNEPLLARYVKVTSKTNFGVLHLLQVQVFA